MAHEPSGTDGHQQSADYDYGQYWTQHQPGTEYEYQASPDYGYAQPAQPGSADANAYPQDPYAAAYTQQQPYPEGAPYADPYAQQTYGAYVGDPAEHLNPNPYEAPTTAPYNPEYDQQYQQNYQAQPQDPYQSYDHPTAAYPHAEPLAEPHTDPYAEHAATETTQQWDPADLGQTLTAGTPVPPAPPAETAATAATAQAGHPAEPAPTLVTRLKDAATGRAPGTDAREFRKRAAIGAGALAVLVLAGVLVAGNGPGGSGSSSASADASSAADLNSAHNKSWSAPADAAAGSNQDGLLGGWLTTGAVVRGDGTAVTAYSRTDGHKLWTVAAPSANAVPCGMSSSVNSAGIGAVLYQPRSGTGQPCSTVVAVDTSTGKTAWSKTLSSSSSTYAATVGVTANRVIAVGDDQAVGYDSASGSQKWSYQGPGQYCTLTGDTGVNTVVVQATCADSGPKQQVIQLGAADGKMSWWRGLPGDAASLSVLSAEPVAIGVNYSDSSKSKVMSFSPTGTSQPDIPAAQPGGTLALSHGSFDPTPSVWFNGTTMVAALNPPSGGAPSAATTVAAYDLSSGKQQWQTKLGEQGQAAPVGIDGSSVVVATEERTGQPARLSNLALSNGQETQGGAFPTGTGSLLTAGRVLYDNSLIATLPAFTTTYNTAATAYKAAG